MHRLFHITHITHTSQPYIICHITDTPGGKEGRWPSSDGARTHAPRIIARADDASAPNHSATRPPICLPYLAWPWPLLSIRSMLIWHLFHPFRSILARFGLTAVISSVSVVDKTKNNDFGLWHDLDLTCHLLILFKLLKKVLIESFRLPPRPSRYGHQFAS